MGSITAHPRRKAITSTFRPTLEPSVLSDPSRLLYLTEGEFKALKLTQEGFPCLVLAGVWSWKTNLHGKSLSIADLDRVARKGRRLVVVFDSDLADKPPVAWAEHELVKELRRRQADVYLLRLPEGPKGAKCGVDDYLVTHVPRRSAGSRCRRRPKSIRIRRLSSA